MDWIEKCLPVSGIRHQNGLYEKLIHLPIEVLSLLDHYAGTL
jgi:hypothetical protein